MLRNQKNFSVLVISILLLLAFVNCFARYLSVETFKVPIERLVKNLEKEVADNSEDYLPRLSLGRLYAMSYSLKSENIEVKSDSSVWLGYEPDNVPHNRVMETDDEEKLRIANEHLEKAIYWYEEALKLAPNDLVVQLGYGWCLDQAGRTEEAKKVYRIVTEVSYEQEKKDKSFDRFSFTAEAHQYLISILDPEEDREELRKLKERLAYIEKHTDFWITPIAIPLKDGLQVQEIIDDNVTVAFNLDGTGIEQNWSWISKNAGWLVHDFHNTAKIESGRDLIGNITFWLFWRNGYDVLRSLDDNSDGELRGIELKGLAIWRDINSNGVSDEKEVLPLSGWGIDALSYSYSEILVNDKHMWYSAHGVHFKDGSTRPTYDIILQRKLNDETITLSDFVLKQE